MTDDDRLTRIRQRDARLTGYLTDAERDRRYLLSLLAPTTTPDYTAVRDSVGEELDHHTPTCNHLIGRQHRHCDCPYNEGGTP